MYGIPSDQSQEKLCDHSGCSEKGLYKAPKSRASVNAPSSESWYWFCLPHIRDYNARWNYYEDMTAEEIEGERRTDMTWKRPTWPLGNKSQFTYVIDDPFGFFEETHYHSPQAQKPTLATDVQKALTLFDLGYPFSPKQLRTNYLSLVKKHHPDMNGGSKASEEFIKRINEAYELLKEHTLSSKQ